MSASNDNNYNNSSCYETRRQLFGKVIAAFVTMVLSSTRSAQADIEGVVTPSIPDPNPKSQADPETGVMIFTTKSGLKYMDRYIPPRNKDDDDVRPIRYGNLVSISYKAFIQLPTSSSKLQLYDADELFLIKHGNGRTIPGLDEGIHTMQTPGHIRRLIIPPKLGYVAPGLGPLPQNFLNRRKLNLLLEQMVKYRGGKVIMDIELKGIMEDEADQGYYEDGSLSVEQFDMLRSNLQESALRAANAREGSRMEGNTIVK